MANQRQTKILPIQGISVVPYVNDYYAVRLHGVPNGAFYWQYAAKHWQGVTRANRLLRPCSSYDECLLSVVEAMEAV
jgi:hypothetical protein